MNKTVIFLLVEGETNVKTDPTVLEILHNYFNAVSSGMSYVVERTSHSSYVTESSDFGTALATIDGNFFAYPKESCVTIFLGLSVKQAIESFGGADRLHPGDILITNDPYSTDGLATHLTDIQIIKPIFLGNELLCYAWAFVHTGDIGGCVPSSLSPVATDVQMEGLRLPPVCLYTEGSLNRDVYSIIKTCSRMPDQLMGDINSMVAAVNTADIKTHDLLKKFGLATIKDGIHDLLEQSELRARKIIGEIPDGKYTFDDYLDDDAISSLPLRVALTIQIHGSDITLDFSNSDPQVPTAFNLITNGTCHTYLYQALIYYIISEDPYIPVNSGIIKPIHAILPKGTLVNAQYPAACGLRHPVSLRIYTALLGALANIIPHKIPAAGGGQAAIVVISVPDPLNNGEYKSNVVEPMSGGDGGQAQADGVEGVDHSVGYLSNTPIEILENETDVLVHRYELVPDSAGAGLYRGGNSICLEFEIVRDNSLVMARGQERMRFQPYGLQGGKAGATGTVLLNPGTDHEQRLSKLKALKLKKGDIVRFCSPSGGGWGQPWNRPTDKVLQDVISGLLSITAAQSDYSVIVRQDNHGSYYIDKDATNQLRQGITNIESTDYDFGNARNAYEQIWTPEASDTLAQKLQRIPPFLRSAYKTKVHDYLGDRDRPITSKDIETILLKLIN